MFRPLRYAPSLDRAHESRADRDPAAATRSARPSAPTNLPAPLTTAPPSLTPPSPCERWTDPENAVDPYLPMWTALNAGNALIALIWSAMTVQALRDRAWIDATTTAIMAALSATWLGTELYAIATGGLLPQDGMAALVASASWLGLASLIAARRSTPGRSLGSIAPLTLALQGPPAALFAFVASGRGVLEVMAPGRRCMGLVLAALLLSTGLQHNRFAVRGAAGSAGMSFDQQTMVAEWMVDGSEVAAWAAAAMWAKRTRGAGDTPDDLRLIDRV